MAKKQKPDSDLAIYRRMLALLAFAREFLSKKENRFNSISFAVEKGMGTVWDSESRGRINGLIILAGHYQSDCDANITAVDKCIRIVNDLIACEEKRLGISGTIEIND